MESLFNKIEKLGYNLEEYSSFEGDKDKMFLCIGATAIAVIDLHFKTVRPCHGYFNKQFFEIATKLGLEPIKFNF